MVKQRILSLLMAGILMLGTIVPAYAAQEDEFGGLAPTEPTTSERRQPEGEPPADDEGGLAGKKADAGAKSTDEESAPAKKPAPKDDIGGLADPNASAKDKGDSEPEEEDNSGKVLAGVSLNASEHIAYVSGSGGQFPTFRPSDGVTRKAAAVMLYRLLPSNATASSATYSDVPADAWYAPAVQAMGALGVMRAGESTFQPDEILTRGEFVRYVASFFPLRTDAELFSDVPVSSEDAPYIRSANAYGWVQGGTDGTFKPDGLLTRAAAVSILNRALGRTADKNYLASHHPAFYLDVAPGTWYYYDIMEASVAHQHSGSETWTSHTARTEVPTEGFHLLTGWLYYYDAAQGDIARNRSVGNFAFDAAGHFTSGNAELDGKLRDIVMAHTNTSMTQEQKLRALYVYTRDSFKYLRRPAYAFGAHDFMVTDALRILNTGYGNCYCYASLFWFLSRWIGYDSVIYSGTVGSNRAPHSWVEIKFDGKWYIFDTELEMAYHRKGRYDINLYKYLDSRNSWMYIRPKT